MDGENQSETVSTPTLTPASEPILSRPSQHPPPPISSSICCPPHRPRRGGRVPRAVRVDAEEVNEVDISDISQPSRD